MISSSKLRLKTRGMKRAMITVLIKRFNGFTLRMIKLPAMMMPIDMMVYLSFHVNSTGGTNDGEYCPLENN
jgi:hypothetical protein